LLSLCLCLPPQTQPTNGLSSPQRWGRFCYDSSYVVKRKKSIATCAATRPARVHCARCAGFRGSFQRRGLGCLSRAASSRSPSVGMRWSSSLFRQRRQVRYAVFSRRRSITSPFLPWRRGGNRLNRVGTEIDRYACRRCGRAAGITHRAARSSARLGVGRAGAGKLRINGSYIRWCSMGLANPNQLRTSFMASRLF
jgi:hypothetical protein